MNETTEATGSSTSKSVAISHGGKDIKDTTMNPGGQGSNNGSSGNEIQSTEASNTHTEG